MRTFYNPTTARFARLAAPASAPKGGPVTDKISIYGLTALVCALCLAATAQAQTSWWRTYGGTNSDCGCSVQQTSDGGYITAGYGAGGDVYLIKTDTSGYALWTRTYGGTDTELGYSVQQTSDGGYIVAVMTSGRYARVTLIKTDAQGDTLWTRDLGSTIMSEGYSVRQTSDGGYIIAAGPGMDFDVYLIKTNASGDTLWTRSYGGTRSDCGYSVQQTSDGGYVIAGYTLSFGAGVYDVYLIKTNASGDTLWTRTYGGTSADCGYSVQQTLDGGYIITGYTCSFGAGAPDSTNVYLIKTDASGDTLWTRTYSGTGNDCGRSVQQTADGGYIIAGYTHYFYIGPPDSANVYLIKTDASGDTLWTRTYGGTSADYGYSVQQTSDGGYIVAGYTASFGAGSYDVYLIKTDSLGRVGIAEENGRLQAPSRKLAASVVRSLPQDATAFDAMGRRALHLKTGIYFVREEPQASSPKPQAVRKVLLVR